VVTTGTKHIDRPPLVVGISGIMGAGKSIVARVFEQLGAKRIDADGMGKELLADPRIRDAIVEVFGPDVRGVNGEIDTASLGILAFQNEGYAKKLDELTGEALTSRIRARIRRLRESAQLIVVDAALLPEWGFKMWLDILVIVDSDEEISLQRLSGTSRFDAESVRGRMRHQFSRRQKTSYADIVIPNYGSLEELRKRARSIFWTLIDLPRKG
jgi:dephospho-CoA kinase